MLPDKIACHCCDQIQNLESVAHGQKAHCSRCGHQLTHRDDNALNKASAFAISALIFLLLALPFPFLAFESQGRTQEVSLLQSGYDLLQLGFPILALLLTLFILLVPALLLCAYLSVLLPLREGRFFPAMYPITRLIFTLHPWGMAEVFLIGVLVSLVKIAGMADIVIGMSFWAYVLFAVSLIATITVIDKHQLWNSIDIAAGTERIPPKAEAGNALTQHLQSCHHCELLAPLEEHHCARCGAALHPRIPFSMQKTWAYLITSVILYIPANVYPIMHTRLLGNDEPSTILGGVVVLWQHGSYPIASVVFIASILVPIGKMLMILWLAFSVQAGHQHKIEERIWMYRLTELIGRWSMIDVFVVAVLVALVQLGGLISITPGVAAVAFASVVIFTMLSALSFDPRLIWDNLSNQEIDAINTGRAPLNDLLDDLS